MELADIERHFLHDICESEGDLPLLVYDVYFYFAKPEDSISHQYQILLAALESLRSKGLVKLVRARYKRNHEGIHEIVAMRDVPDFEVHEVLRNPRNWDRSSVWGDQERLMFVSTDLGESRVDALMGTPQ